SQQQEESCSPATSTEGRATEECSPTTTTAERVGECAAGERAGVFDDWKEKEAGERSFFLPFFRHLKPLVGGRGVQKMIRFILLQNRQGKTRLAKYYVPLEDSEKHRVEYEVHRLVVNRDPKFTNFVEFRTHKVIYRRYAGLFFSLCVDITDNELAYLECIHLFVEILDHFFSNVCELDLVFNFHKVYLILDEFILAGELQETSKRAIIERMGELEKLE
ncbi:AP-2 complex subunit sigma, partial [Linum grandiflorum]